MRVLIAGCGDVGNVLATSLQKDGHLVFGLKRDISSLANGIQPVAADLLQPATLTGLPQDLDALVFMPTPARRDRTSYEAIFIEGWNNLWKSLNRAPARILLVSSTAVYGESGGAMVDENAEPNPTAFNGKALLKMEQNARRCSGSLVVVRVSGIYGPGRERLIRLAATAGYEVQKSPPYFTNRIHRDDAAAALKHLLELDKPETVYLATDDKPVAKYEVVEWLARKQSCVPPTGLTCENAGLGKRVSNQRLRDSGFRMLYPDYKAGYTAVMKNR